MAVKPEPYAPKSEAWENVSVTAYPGADGKEKHPEPGDLITDAAEGWPPDWVVDAGHIRPATSEKE
jgi:hypothetical protein